MKEGSFTLDECRELVVEILEDAEGPELEKSIEYIVQSIVPSVDKDGILIAGVDVVKRYAIADRLAVKIAKSIRHCVDEGMLIRINSTLMLSIDNLLDPKPNTNKGILPIRAFDMPEMKCPDLPKPEKQTFPKPWHSKFPRNRKSRKRR